MNDLPLHPDAMDGNGRREASRVHERGIVRTIELAVLTSVGLVAGALVGAAVVATVSGSALALSLAVLAGVTTAVAVPVTVTRIGSWLLAAFAGDDQRTDDARDPADRHCEDRRCVSTRSTCLQAGD